MAQTPRRKLAVALGQFEPVWLDVPRNMGRMREFIDEAGRKGADLLIFPELSRTGYAARPSPSDLARVAELLPSPDSRLLMDAAARHNMAVVYGTLLRDKSGAYNAAVWVENDTCFVYRKTHVHWSEAFLPGAELCGFDSRLVTAAVLICFELAFPEAAAALARKGVRLLVAPSAVPSSFQAIARRRVVARALDNQIFAAYCNACGTKFGGGSLVVDPRGEIVMEAGGEPGVFVTSLELPLIDRWRKQEPLDRFRRPELY